MSRLRTYLAGLGSGGALLAAVLAGLIALGAIVAVEGMPDGSSDLPERSIMVDSNAPEAAAAAAAAPAASPARRAPDLDAGAATIAATGAASDPGAPAATGGGAVPAPGGGTLVPGSPGTSPAPGPGGAGPAPSPGPGVPGVPELPGDVSGVVDGVDRTVEGATGIDLGLTDATKPLTDSIDRTVKGLTGGQGLGLSGTP